MFKSYFDLFPPDDEPDPSPFTAPEAPKTRRCDMCDGVTDPYDYSYTRPIERPDGEPSSGTAVINMRVDLCPVCDLGRPPHIQLGEN